LSCLVLSCPKDEEEETLVLFCRRLLIAAPESFSASTLPSYPSVSLLRYLYNFLVSMCYTFFNGYLCWFLLWVVGFDRKGLFFMARFLCSYQCTKSFFIYFSFFISLSKLNPQPIFSMLSFFFFAFIKFYLLFLCSCNPNLDLHIFHCQGSLMQFTATSDDVLCSGYDSVFHYNDYDLFYKKFLMRDLKRDMVTMNILIH
jgi:hypothetical protein